MSSTTVVQWYQDFRDICSWKLLQVPMRLGGVGRVVQVDESVIARAKYNCASRLFARTRWIFGICDPVSKVGFVEMVPNRNAHTLRCIIRHVVVPGTEIWSKEWRAYQMIGQMGLRYVHRTVNHSRHFRDPVTGVCTNHVEAYWSKRLPASSIISSKIFLVRLRLCVSTDDIVPHCCPLP